MNGSNSLEEANRQGHQLCPVCLRKLHWAVRFDAMKRYRELAAFYRQQDWTEETLWANHQLAKVATSAGATIAR